MANAHEEEPKEETDAPRRTESGQAVCPGEGGRRDTDEQDGGGPSDGGGEPGEAEHDAAEAPQAAPVGGRVISGGEVHRLVNMYLATSATCTRRLCRPRCSLEDVCTVCGACPGMIRELGRHPDHHVDPEADVVLNEEMISDGVPVTYQLHGHAQRGARALGQG